MTTEQTPKAGDIDPRDLGQMIVPVARQRYHGRARSGNIIALGGTVIYVGPNPEARNPGRSGPPLLRVGRVGEEWKTVAVFPNATSADDFIHALEVGLSEQKEAGAFVHNSLGTEASTPLREEPDALQAGQDGTDAGAGQAGVQELPASGQAADAADEAGAH